MGGASFDEEEPVMNYEQAMKEISVNELAQGGSCYKIAYNYFLIIILDPIYSKMHEKLMEKHQAEKEGKLKKKLLRFFCPIN